MIVTLNIIRKKDAVSRRCVVVMGCGDRSRLDGQHMGCGDGAKAASAYTIKYCSKCLNVIAHSLPVFVAANAAVQENPSSAEDTGTATRTAKHFARGRRGGGS